MLKIQKALNPYFLFLMMGLCLFSLMSCGVRKTVTSDQDQTSQNVVQTENTYRKAIIHPFEADQHLSKIHPNAAVLCENAMFHELLKTGAIPMIVKTASTSLREADTIIVKVRLSYLRETQQIRGQTKTGPAKMTAQVRLIDASTGKTIHENNISLAVQTATAFPGDAPELGKLIARHVSQIIRSK